MPSVGMSRPATSATAGMRRTTPPSRSTVTRPWPAAAASITSTLLSSPGKRLTRETSPPPTMRTGARRPGGADCAAGSSIPATPSTTGRPAMTEASTLSLLGRAASRPASSGSRPGMSRASRSGDRRSGSGITMSSPMAAGRPRPISSTSRARSVRGHGHWP